MARIPNDSEPNKQPKTKVYEVVVKSIQYNKTGPKVTYSHTIKYPGWEDFFEEG
jgi:hypothetical protein